MLNRSLTAVAPTRAPLTRPDWWHRVIARAPAPQADTLIRIRRPAMACQFEITLPEHLASRLDAARQALDHVDALEAQLTVFRDTSEIAHINRCGAVQPVVVDPGLFDLRRRCEAIGRATGGAFDITSTPLSRCRGVMRREGRLPGEDELAEEQSAVGMTAVDLDAGARTVQFTNPRIEPNLGSDRDGRATADRKRRWRRRARAFRLMNRSSGRRG